MLKFELSISNIQTFSKKFSNRLLLEEITKLEGIGYSLTCFGASNNYQLISDFDDTIKENLLKFGAEEYPFTPNCNESIDYDFSLSVSGSNAVFEIEKANKEKLLYDFLKMHIYLESGADVAVLICPHNWAHSKGTYDLFSLAKERFTLCERYGMLNEKFINNMLIVGFTQTYRGKVLDKKLLLDIKSKCKLHFDSQ